MNNRRRTAMYILTLAMLMTYACRSSGTATGEITDVNNQESGVSGTTAGESTDLNNQESGVDEANKLLAYQIISSDLINNTTEIDIGIEDLLVMSNPKGEGFFIYVQETSFFGVERNIHWLFINDQVYVLNGATKNLTPNILWPREAETEEWELTGLSPYSATESIELIWGSD